MRSSPSAALPAPHREAGTSDGWWSLPGRWLSSTCAYVRVAAPTRAGGPPRGCGSPMTAAACFETLATCRLKSLRAERAARVRLLDHPGHAGADGHPTSSRPRFAAPSSGVRHPHHTPVARHEPPLVPPAVAARHEWGSCIYSHLQVPDSKGLANRRGQPSGERWRPAPRNLLKFLLTSLSLTADGRLRFAETETATPCETGRSARAPKALSLKTETGH
jgi:hypothetical protein